MTGRIRIALADVPMSVTFTCRGLAYFLLVLLGLWKSPWLLYAAVIFMGLSWSSTISLLATSCSDLYGQRGQGSVFGIVFGMMNWSMTFGAWIPGVMFDHWASYQSALYLNVIIAWIASGVILWIGEWWQRPQTALRPMGEQGSR